MWSTAVYHVFSSEVTGQNHSGFSSPASANPFFLPEDMKKAQDRNPTLTCVSSVMRCYLILDGFQIIQMGRIYVFLSMAESSSLRQRIAPVPLGTEALSRTLKAEASSVPGFVLFLISSG